MRIGIDARLLSQTGVGRYIRNLLRVLGKIDHENDYFIYLIKEDYYKFELPSSRWTKRLVNIRWHSFAEQIFMPLILYKDKLNLVHFPYFNVPIFYRKKFIITVHDLTHLHFDTGQASTLPLFLYQVKRMGLKIVLDYAINNSQKIIAVSEATKKEMIDHYHVDSQKISVTYEAVDELNISVASKIREKETNQLSNFLLYVGNAYPHKNLNLLVDSFTNLIREETYKNLKLVLVGPEDFFYKRLKKSISNLLSNKNLVFYGPANDSELKNLYKKANCTIIPSLMEGFGLVGLEAMSEDCLVIASNIPSLKEIYKEAAIFFNPKEKEDLIEKIKLSLSNIELKKKLIASGKELVSSYSWDKLGITTKKIYETFYKQ